MDIMIPVADNTSASFAELKYCLRSVEKYIKNFDRVFIVGKVPDFIDKKNIQFFLYKDNLSLCKQQRIMEKIKFACLQTDISEDFVFMNDDYFFLKDLDTAELDFCYDRRLSEKILQRGIFDDYAISMVNTLCNLSLRKFDDKNFDTHYPIIYNKTKFPEVMNQYDWKVKLGYVIKSLYCNSLKLRGKEKRDVKISSIRARFETDMQKADDMFSTNDIIPGYMRDFLNTLFPEKSRFEK